MDLSSFSTQELIVLCKALHFVRFESLEPGASEVVGSPAMGHLYAQAHETLWAKVDTRTTAFCQANGFGDVAAKPERIAALLYHISQVEPNNWNGMSDPTKLDDIQDLVFPFDLTPQILERLLQYGNHVHQPQG
ncbi:hypothetical protein [Hymenobacter persicinus]|uniref:Uncharacterized protein n=1 Tax=Hymenobacter persicinus TaxID=2025506 RepID=A0A4V1ZB09_9BACT|nr:hypothetical protein [Hymenobacter persicinus]RYU81822.1 hypothetical protein EWM57_05430 [Hymenobacter persicinus]